MEVKIPLDTLNIVLSVALPMLTALVTARFASSQLKSLTLLALTIISTALQQVFDDGGSFVLNDFLLTTTLQFVMSVGLHFGLLKPASITGDHGIVSRSIPAGLGGPSDPPVGPIPD